MLSVFFAVGATPEQSCRSTKSAWAVMSAERLAKSPEKDMDAVAKHKAGEFRWTSRPSFYGSRSTIPSCRNTDDNMKF